jgi:hypothetical protein
VVKIELSGRAEGVPVEERKIIPYGQVDHLELQSQDLRLCPSPDIITVWQADFEKMG